MRILTRMIRGYTYEVPFVPYEVPFVLDEVPDVPIMSKTMPKTIPRTLYEVSDVPDEPELTVAMKK